MYNNDSQTFLKISTKTCPAAWVLHGDLQIKTTGNVYDSAQKQIHTQLAKNNCSAINLNIIKALSLCFRGVEAFVLLTRQMFIILSR